MQKKEKVLILGGGGFIGSHLAAHLLEGYSLKIFDKKNCSTRNLDAIKDKIDIIEGDFNNINDLKPLVRDADYIIHLVWSTLPVNVNCVYDVESNVISFLKFLNLIKDRPPQKILFVSSGGTVYGDTEAVPLNETMATNPICSYGITKLMVEKYLHLFQILYKLNFAVARLSNVFGERQDLKNRQGLIITLIHRMMNKLPIEIWGDGQNVRDYIHVQDVVEGLRKLLCYEGFHRIFNLSSGRGYSILEMVDRVASSLNLKAEIEFIGERPFDVRQNILDNSLAKNELDWQPRIQLDEGIRRVADWLSLQRNG